MSLGLHNGTTSYWFKSADLQPRRPPLMTRLDVDVAIVGAGFSGLWTAYYLLRNQPDLRVVVLEQRHVGFGASGRNGGWCNGKLAITAAELRRRYGATAARNTLDAVGEAVQEVEAVCALEGIDARFRLGGHLRVARSPHELPVLHKEAAHMAALGLAERAEMLDKDDVRDRIRVPDAQGALFDWCCAAVDPGRLVAGLAAAVERRDGVIYERTPVSAVRPGAPGRRPLLSAQGESVVADTVVLAGEAYITQLRSLRRRLVPLYSLITLTEPLTEEQWAAVGWSKHECLSSGKYTSEYLSRTVDGRMLIGGRGAPYHLGSRIKDRYDLHRPTHRKLQRALLDWFPQLEDVAFEQSWGGPLGMPRDWLPSFSYDPNSGIASALGYTGQGVAASNLAGRIIDQLIRGEESEFTALPAVNHVSPSWEMEPFRWLGIHFVQSGLFRVDRKAQRKGVTPQGGSLAERLARH